jgi:hypothetical protein
LGGKTATTTQQVQIPPEVLARYQNVNERAQQVSETPFQRYTGEFVAPLSPTQQYGIQQTVASAQLAQPYYQAATQLGVTGAQGIRPGALDPGAYMSPYTQAVVQATLNPLQQQQRQQLSQQQSEAIRSGAFGGDRGGLQRAALMGQQAMGTAQAIAPLYQQGYTQALQTAQQQQGLALSAEQANRAARAATAQQLAGFGAGAQQAAQAGAQGIIGAGTLEQQTRQALNAALLQQFQQERGYPFQVAQFLANIAYGAPYPTTTTTTQPIGLFGALSDRRAKKDIKRVGKTDDGMPIYKYKYKGDPSGLTHMGLMAQDVEKTKPEAVGLAGGLKTVDYDRATKFYGGGVGDSMGGAVVEPGAYADGGLADILAIQRAMYGQQGGAPGGLGGGSPYGKGIVDIVPLQAFRPDRPGAPQQMRQTSLSDIYGGAKSAKEMALGLKSLATGAGPTAEQQIGIAGKLRSGEITPEEADKLTKGLTSRGLFGAGGEWDTSKGLIGSASRFFEADGGLVGYARGGSANDDDDMPYGDTSGGLGIPQQKIQPFRPQAPGQPSDPSAREKQGLSDLKALYGMGEMAATGLESILPFLFLSTGGLVPRAGFADGGWSDIVEEEARKRNIPASLLRAIIQQESSGEPRAVGSAGEIGLGQIKPSTARDPGYGVTPVDPRNLTRPEVNIPFMADYLTKKAAALGYKDLNDPAQQRQALMAYNAGRDRERYADKVLARMTGLAAPRAVKSSPPGAGEAPRAALAANVDDLPMARVTPGLAGPGYVQETPETAPFKYGAGQLIKGLGISPETKSALTSENLWLPLLAGVGSMLTSPSLRLPGAIGAGLLGGTKTYMDLQKQQQEMGRSRAETEKIVADLSSGAFSEAGGILRVRVVDPATGAYRLMSNAEWLSLPEGKRPPIDPRVPRDVLQKWAQSGKAIVPGAPAEDGAPPAPTATGAVSTVPKPEKIQSTPLPPPERAPPRAPKEPEAPTGTITLSPEEAAEAHREAVTIANLSSAGRASLQQSDMFMPQAKIATSAQQAKMSLLPLASTVMAIPEGQSLATSGPFSAAIAPYVATIQNLAEMATGKKGIVIDPATLANREEAQKLIDRLATETTTQAGQTALQAIDRIAKGIVSLSQSKGGQKQILANVLAQTQREIDKDRFFANWQKAGETAPGGQPGAFRDYARLSSVPAARKFDERYGRAFYDQEEKRLLSMMNTKVKNPDDPQKPISMFEFVARYGPAMNADDLKVIKQKYGEGITRYFGFGV